MTVLVRRQRDAEDFVRQNSWTTASSNHLLKKRNDKNSLEFSSKIGRQMATGDDLAPIITIATNILHTAVFTRPDNISMIFSSFNIAVMLSIHLDSHLGILVS